MLKPQAEFFTFGKLLKLQLVKSVKFSPLRSIFMLRLDQFSFIEVGKAIVDSS